MSQQQVLKYLETQKQLELAYSKIRQIQSTLQDVVKYLNQPLHFLISGSNVRFPREVALGEVPCLEARGWPTADQMAQCIVSLHKAYKETISAWMDIPNPEKLILSPPSDIK